MPDKWIFALVIASALAAVTTIVYGPITLLFPWWGFPLFYVLAFRVETDLTVIQATHISGLENLGEPDFYEFPRFHSVWLYLHDEDGWVRHATFSIYLTTLWFGTTILAFIGLALRVDFYAVLACWFLGVFCGALAALKMAEDEGVNVLDFLPTVWKNLRRIISETVSHLLR